MGAKRALCGLILLHLHPTFVYDHFACLYKQPVIVIFSLLTMFGYDRSKLNVSLVPADENYKPLKPLIDDGSHHRPRFEGWRYAVLLCSLFTSSVLFVNISVMTWAVATHGWGGREGRQVLYEGSCDKASRLNTGLHFIINALSTVILSSSSYCMQCLSAPTRGETEFAHLEGRWMDIGIFSVRNLKRIARKRSILWCILGISTVPIHWL